MRMTSFRINGLAVSRLSINGRNVLLGNASCDALCFTAEEAGSTVKLHKVGSAPDVNLLTSTNGSSWTPYTVEDVITLANIGDKVYFKAVGSNTKIGNDGWSYNNFVMTGKISASGNVNSLLEEDEETARTMSLAGRDQCYRNMFYNCTSLTKTPELPATTLANSCYEHMFENCASLTSTSELPATTRLPNYCYLNMFSGCTSLTQAPELPSMTLTHSCYNSMFSGCTSLIYAPELPATTLAQSCYENMFNGCTSLIKAPELPATAFSGLWCYRWMFRLCSKLNYVKVMLTNWAGDATEDWLPENVGTFECPQALIDNTTERTTSTVPSTWNMVDVQLYLCFTAEEAGSTVKLHKVNSAPDVNLQTSTDGSSWTPYTVEDTITLANIGDKVYFKAVGSNERMATTDSNYHNFVMTGKIAAYGNLNSLLEEDKETAYTMSLYGKMYCYKNMFKDCSSLTKAPNLPATTLYYNCYESMFLGCTSLTQAPVLSAKTLAQSCYGSMFLDCTSLTQAPALPATTSLPQSCYNGMFLGCTSLTQAPALPATELGTSSYEGMFRGCTSLTKAPEINATTASNPFCYRYMFLYCSNLNYVRVALNDWGDYYTRMGWLEGVAESGTLECPQALIDNTTERGINTVPESWTMVAV